MDFAATTKYLFRYIIDNLENISIPDRIELADNYLVCPIGLYESYGFYIINFMNEFCQKMNLNHRFNPGYNYDLQDENYNRNTFWIFLCDSSVRRPYNVEKYLKKQNYIVFDFSHHRTNNSFYLPDEITNSSDKKSIVYSIGCLYVSILLSASISDKNNYSSSKGYFADRLKEFERAWTYMINSEELNEEIDFAARALLSKRNWKCLGSGVNYNTAKFASKNLINQLNRVCAFDVLENHKHIDISAESAIIIFIANIWRQGYQNDVRSEIEKLVSHNNLPIIVTNIGDTRFDGMQMNVNYGGGRDELFSIPIIRIPNIDESYTFTLTVYVIEQLISALKQVSQKESHNIYTQIAVKPPSSLVCS